MKTWQEMEPRERDAWIAENVMGLSGIGYHGPPEDKPFAHIRSRMFPTEEQANAAYAEFHDKYHKDNPYGYCSRDEWDAELCYWRQGWGPIVVNDYSTEAGYDYEVLRKMIQHPDVLVRRRFVVHLIKLSGCWGERSRLINLHSLLEKHAEAPGLFSHAAYLTITENGE